MIIISANNGEGDIVDEGALIAGFWVYILIGILALNCFWNWYKEARIIYDDEDEINKGVNEVGRELNKLFK